jgi:uncharacterized ParB-like nuclease family protein
MAKKERTPERAAKILDRAARMPSRRVRNIHSSFDKQMKTPSGVASEPFNKDTVKAKKPAVQEIDLSKVKSIQKTIGVDGVKSKLKDAATGKGAMPEVFSHNGKYYVNDGNHRVTAARALGKTSIRAVVTELVDIPKAAQAVPKAAPKIGGKVGLALAVAGLAGAAYAAVKKAAADADKSSGSETKKPEYKDTWTDKNGVVYKRKDTDMRQHD